MSETTNSNQENKIVCVVKWFNSRKGYGFITSMENNNDYFVHQSQLEPTENCFKTLYIGEYIECFIKKDNETNKEQAYNVTGIQGGKLMCEHSVRNNLPNNNYSNNYDKNNRYNYS